MSLLNNRITAVLAGSALVVGLGATGAVAGDLIGSADIRDGGVRSVDLAPGVNDRIKTKATDTQVNGLKSRVAGLEGSDPAIGGVEADGPYPGMTNLVHGDNSTATWNSTGLNLSWVQCAEGETAIGGGFARGDEGNYNDLNVVTASPALIRDGQVISIAGMTEADGVNEDWAFVPNGWAVEGFVNGPGERVVRPYVVCATVAD